jgi:hypothetical protein
MAEEVRRQRQDSRVSRRSAWRIVLLGKPIHAATYREVPSGTPPTVLARLAVVWPRRSYRQVEERWNYAPSVVLFRALLLFLMVVFGSLIGGVGALVALATGQTASDGFADGIILSCLLLAVAAAYLGWGGLIAWLSQRRRTH